VYSQWVVCVLSVHFLCMDKNYALKILSNKELEPAVLPYKQEVIRSSRIPPSRKTSFSALKTGIPLVNTYLTDSTIGLLRQFCVWELRVRSVLGVYFQWAAGRFEAAGRHQCLSPALIAALLLSHCPRRMNALFEGQLRDWEGRKNES
jgi:hypothetical protein